MDLLYRSFKINGEESNGKDMVGQQEWPLT